MLRGLICVSKLPKGASSPLFQLIKHEDPSKLLMGLRKQGSSASACMQVADNVSNNNKEELPEQYPIFKRSVGSKLHLNLCELPAHIQGSFADLYMEQLTKELQDSPYHTIHINNVNEEVFRYNLNMPIRRLGYSSTYTRYNHGLGIATFEKV